MLPWSLAARTVFVPQRRFGFVGPVELSTSAFMFANLGHVPSERWRERFLAEALKFRVSRGASDPYHKC
jgi:hypothetical protein